MGWSFRKSTSLGPFRLNFSRSGLGMSFGVKGARISVNKRGTYVNLGVNGVYYRQRIGGNNTNTNNRFVPTPDPAHSYSSPHTITTENIENVTDVDSQAFVEELESKAKKISLFKFFGIWPSLGIFLYVLASLNDVVKVNDEYKNVFIISKSSVNVRGTPFKDGHIIQKAKRFEKYDVAGVDSTGWVKIILQTANSTGFVRADMGDMSKMLIKSVQITRAEEQPWLKVVIALLLIVLVIWCIFLFKQDQKRKTLEIYYTLDNKIKDLHQKFLTCFQEFASSKKIWQKLHEQGTSESKYHAGASKLISRISIKDLASHRLPTSFLKTNISIPYIGLKNTELYFFPERLILKRGNKFGAAFYKNIEIRSNNVRFIEEETVPSDADIVDHTWKYLNKKGGPDKRFNNNRILPVCLYTEYTFASESGIEEVITTSKTGGMDNFMKFLRTIGDYQEKIH